MGIYEGIGMVYGVITYALIFLFAIIGAFICWINKKRAFAFWWVSVMANFFAYLYLLGGYGDLAYAMQIVAMIAWPIINIAWFADLIRTYYKNKKRK